MSYGCTHNIRAIIPMSYNVYESCVDDNKILCFLRITRFLKPAGKTTWLHKRAIPPTHQCIELNKLHLRSHTPFKKPTRDYCILIPLGFYTICLFSRNYCSVCTRIIIMLLCYLPITPSAL